MNERASERERKKKEQGRVLCAGQPLSASLIDAKEAVDRVYRATDSRARSPGRLLTRPVVLTCERDSLRRVRGGAEILFVRQRRLSFVARLICVCPIAPNNSRGGAAPFLSPSFLPPFFLPFLLFSFSPVQRGIRKSARGAHTCAGNRVKYILIAPRRMDTTTLRKKATATIHREQDSREYPCSPRPSTRICACAISLTSLAAPRSARFWPREITRSAVLRRARA